MTWSLLVRVALLSVLIAVIGCQERLGRSDGGPSDSTETVPADDSAIPNESLEEDTEYRPLRRVTGFASVPWGSSLSEIVSRYGAPTNTVAGKGDVTIYAYANEVVLERDVLMGFVVHDRFGLFKGGYTIDVKDQQEALKVFYEFANTISFRYPGLPAIRCPAEKACDELIAIPVDRAIQWSDATYEAAIAIGLVEGSDSYKIRIDYETRAFRP